MSGESVKVAVRCRPFNSREKERGAKLIIQMNGKNTVITNPADSQTKTFAFDYSYWSHDSFTEDSNGYLNPDPGSNYSSQRVVFEDLGMGVLNNAYEGYNTSLFAYGQTGSGKSYSMIGYGSNKGIVPITCDELFKKIDGSTDDTKFEVKFSMLEIYNEQVRDLLCKTNPKGGLPVRENPKLGLFYVGDLKKVAVGSYAEIERRIEEGNNNRTVASTQMNATSSRAHTVVTIEFVQKKMQDGKEMAKTSVMNLVDLAGSERADSTGATGDRLKEGANINKSLSALGNVIKALADISMGTKKKVNIPYRDSVLTKLLKNALGGNSKTIMIAALSPADINYDETLSTLRYADRAKNIKNKAVVNENPVDKLIRELKEENERLKKSLQGGGLPMAVEGAGTMSPEEIAEMRKQMEEDIRAQLALNAQQIDSGFGGFDAELAAAQKEDVQLLAQAASQKALMNQPRLTNLNEDPQLSGVIHHYLNKDEITIGRKDADPTPTICLTGLGVQKFHAVIKKTDDGFKIAPGASNAKVKINGVPITSEVCLNNKDRVVLGSNHVYVFCDPTKAETSEGTPEGNIDWDFAQKELAENSGFSSAGLTADQARVQEHVLELLPMISEVNAVSEELNKYRHFELVLLGAATQDDNQTKVMVQMKDVATGNLWLWERGKFMNRRYIIQEMYQQFLDDDESWKTCPKDKDPFWDEVEDYAVGTSSAFLQSLSYSLDFEDKLQITDHRGLEQGNLTIVLTPCDAKGQSLGEDDFNEDPNELVGKPYHVKVDVRDAEVYNSRFNHGLYVKYGCSFAKETKDHHKTKTVTGTLAPSWKDSRMISIDKVTEEIIEIFESDSINFTVMAVQKAGDGSTPKLSTRELKEKQSLTSSNPNEGVAKTSQRRMSVNMSAKGNVEMAVMNKRLDVLARKEARIQELVRQYEKSKKTGDFLEFYNKVNQIANSSGKFKKTVKMIGMGGNKADTISVYSFEFDQAKHSYDTGANNVAGNLDTFAEEEEFNEDLDSPVPASATKSEPEQSLAASSKKESQKKPAATTSTPAAPTAPPTKETKSKACAIM